MTQNVHGKTEGEQIAGGSAAAQGKRYSTSEVVDVAVIGTGAGGAPVLARLAQAGLSVVALEAGRWWNPGTDFATDEVAQAPLYWLDERLSAGETPTAFGGNNSGTGVGGSTLHWGAFCPRADERDLRMGRDFGGASSLLVDWPMSYDDLLPYYLEVEELIGMSGPEHYPWDPTRRYPCGPVALNAPAQAMEKGCAALGVRTSVAPIAVVTRDYTRAGYPVRHACVNRGYCHQGCRNGAKASMDVTYLPIALAHGAEIRPDCFVHDIELDEAGRVAAVVYRETNVDGGHAREVRQRCKAVFLCAGAVETPRLLLHIGRNGAAAKGHGAGLANSSGQVGKNFMAHVSSQVWGTFPEEMRMNKGFPAVLITEDPMRPKDADFAGGYLAQSLGVVPVTFARQVARGRGLWGKPLVNYLDGYNYIAGIGMNGDGLPYEHNFLELSAESDANGMAKPLVHYSYGENERRMSKHGEKLMTEAWKAAGASDIWTFQRSAHVIGTCRMGTDPKRAVTDRFGRTFDVPNLWISDNSTFPTSLAANPALTIMALALRSADAFLAARRG